jgi:glutamyl-tRNA synthetase
MSAVDDLSESSVLQVETKGRFAPSPTGELHLGNARTALLAWLWARSEGGAFAMRVEDIDTPRVKPGMAAQQLDELAWLGLNWDGEPMYQSRRTAAYQEAIAAIKDHTYECFCSRAEIAAAASAPHGDEGPRYPGTCRELTESQRAEKRKTRAPSLRLRVPDGSIAWNDEILGPQSVDTQSLVGDFVLRRADGIFAYQLAVVVDDGAQKVTQVLRGADLLPSTARQILLHELLGQRVPRFAHAPLVLSQSGERLSKRDQAMSLSWLRAQGKSPRQIVADLARMSGMQTSDEAQPRDLLKMFSPQRVPKQAVRTG